MSKLESSIRNLIAVFVSLTVLSSALSPAIGADDKPGKMIGFAGSVGVQHDSAVNTQATENQSNKADWAALIDLGVSLNALDREDLGLELSYDFSQSLYDQLTTFNFQSHGLAIFVDTTRANFDWNALYGYTRAFVGGQDFLGLHIFQPSVGRLASSDWYVSAAYSFQKKNFIDADARDAQLHAGEVTNFIFLNGNTTTLKLGYRFEHENASDAEFDYYGNYFKAGLKIPTPLRLTSRSSTLSLNYQFDIKNYTSETAEIGKERLDRRHTAKLAFDVPLYQHVNIVLEAEYLNTSSNLPSSDVVQRVYTFSLRSEF